MKMYALVYLIIAIVILFIIVSNALVIVIVLTKSCLKSHRNWFLLSLATIDFLIGVFLCPIALAQIILDRWPLGSSVCQIWLTLKIVFCTASILNVCAIGIDRYRSVMHPVSYRQPKGRFVSFILLMLCWFFSICFGLAPVFGWGRTIQISEDVCKSPRLRSYVVFSTVGTFIIPLIAIIGLYVTFCCSIRRRFRRQSDQLTAVLRLIQSPENDERLKLSLEAPHRSMSQAFRGKRIRRRHPKVLTCVVSTNIYVARSIHFSPYLTHMITRELAPTRNIDNMKNDIPRRKMGLAMRTSAPLTPLKETKSMQSNIVIKRSFSSLVSQMEHYSDTIDVHALKRSNASEVYRRKISGLEIKNRKSLLLTFCTIFCFIVCWLPFFVVYVLRGFNIHADPGIFDALVLLGFCSSACNPIIYGFHCPDVRKGFQRCISRK